MRAGARWLIDRMRRVARAAFSRPSLGWWLGIAIATVFFGGIGLFAWRPWDPRVSEAQARAAVAAKFPRVSKVRCERSEQTDDGSLPGLGEVDYECRVGGGQGFPRVLVGSDGERVTAKYSYGGP